MRLSPTRFNRHARKLGQDIAWRRAHDCPCRTPYTGGARTDCAQCHGVGFLWDAAVPAYAGVAGMRTLRQWAQFGLFETGDTVLSLPSDTPAYAMGENDRVTMVQSSIPFSLTMTRGQDDYVRFDLVAIDRTFWLDDAQAIVESPAPQVGAGGALVWPAGSVPDVGRQFTISGRKRPEYFCFQDFPQDRAHQGGDLLPRRVVLRRFDLFGRGQ